MSKTNNTHQTKSVEKLKAFGNEHFSKNFEIKERTTKGWNRGDVKIESNFFFLPIITTMSVIMRIIMNYIINNMYERELSYDHY